MEQFFASLSFGGDANVQFNPMTAVVMIDDDDSKFCAQCFGSYVGAVEFFVFALIPRG